MNLNYLIGNAKIRCDVRIIARTTKGNNFYFLEREYSFDFTIEQMMAFVPEAKHWDIIGLNSDDGILEITIQEE